MCCHTNKLILLPPTKENPLYSTKTLGTPVANIPYPAVSESPILPMISISPGRSRCTLVGFVNDLLFCVLHGNFVCFEINGWVFCKKTRKITIKYQGWFQISISTANYVLSHVQFNYLFHIGWHLILYKRSDSILEFIIES